jgi:hypothetical protein
VSPQLEHVVYPVVVGSAWMLCGTFCWCWRQRSLRKTLVQLKQEDRKTLLALKRKRKRRSRQKRKRPRHPPDLSGRNPGRTAGHSPSSFNPAGTRRTQPWAILGHVWGMLQRAATGRNGSQQHSAHALTRNEHIHSRRTPVR